MRGSSLPPHLDLNRTDREGRTSTHTFLLYLLDCAEGGETALLERIPKDADKAADRGDRSGGGKTLDELTLAAVKPRRGRLLAFPHLWPHMGCVVQSAPKVALRGDML